MSSRGLRWYGRQRNYAAAHGGGGRDIRRGPVVHCLRAPVRATAQWRGITVTTFERRQCEVIREEVNAAHGQRHASLITRPRARRGPGAAGER